MKRYILAIDSGTSSVRTLIFDDKANIIAIEQQELSQIYPKPDHVEHDPVEIWKKQLATMRKAVEKAGIGFAEISAIAITNQRETTIAWDKVSGEPVHNAIVWQDKRTAKYCEQLKKQGLQKTIQQKTGLIIDSYFSATKIKWILENSDKAKLTAARGNLNFGTVDCWLLWKLTGGKSYATDYSNASRTMLFNINKLEWDQELIKLFRLENINIPQAKPSCGEFGYTDKDIFDHEIPIYAMIGDQQAALFGQCCFEHGDCKNTYGTGCFMLMNIGEQAKISDNGIITTIAWGLEGKVEYAFEAAIFDAGSAMVWLRDNMQIASNYASIDRLAEAVEDSLGLVFIPAFSGLGAPHWNMEAKASLTGISHATRKEHFARAVLEGIAAQVNDVIGLMQQESGCELTCLNVDGGLSRSDILMQIQANLLQKPVNRQQNHEMTASGAAYLAGIKAGLWNRQELLKINKTTEIKPDGNAEKRDHLLKKWQAAINKMV